MPAAPIRGDTGGRFGGPDPAHSHLLYSIILRKWCPLFGSRSGGDRVLESFGEATSDQRAQVDVVYTWVDGASDDFRAAIAAAAETHRAFYRADPDPLAIGANRFREMDLLRYSMRSVDAFFPWARTIYIVTNGQVPRWLDAAHPRVRIVSHAEIFPDAGVLPCFNSWAIETCLPRIPGLSRFFLYLNDDFLFGKVAQEGDFWGRAGRLKARFREGLMNTDIDHPDRQARCMAYAAELLDTRFGRKRFRRGFPHVPTIFDCRVLDWIEIQWPLHIRRTRSHRFRNERDFPLHPIYAHCLAEIYELSAHDPAMGDLVDILPGNGGAYIPFGDPECDIKWRTRHYLEQKPAYLCINDVAGEVGDITDDHLEDQREDIMRFLADYFPKAASWEYPD